MSITVKEIARRLSNVYNSDFRGKKKGRFSLDRSDFNALTGMWYITPLLVDLQNEMSALGLFITEFEDRFIVVESATLRGWRSPSKLVIASAIAEDPLN